MIYIDDAYIRYGRMQMCHMIADNTEELHNAASRIGVDKRHFQHGRRSQYDVCKKMRQRAVELGAVEVTRRDVVHIKRVQIQYTGARIRQHCRLINRKATDVYVIQNVYTGDLYGKGFTPVEAWRSVNVTVKNSRRPTRQPNGGVQAMT